MLFMCFVNGGEEEAFANFSPHVYVTFWFPKLVFCYHSRKPVKYVSDKGISKLPAERNLSIIIENIFKI